MSKNTSKSKYVFRQICEFLNRDAFEWYVAEYNGNHYIKTLSSWQHLLIMILGQLWQCRSLRVLVNVLNSQSSKLYQLGIGLHATQSIDTAESGFVSSMILYSKDLTRNAVIRLSWHPACVCICQYKGEDQFEVIRSENTQLIPGTTFYCTLFIEGEILYLDKVSFPNNSDVFTYKIGAEHGIVFCLLLE